VTHHTGDYESLELVNYVNADDDVPRTAAQGYRGEVSLRGFPFHFAERSGRSRVVRVVPRGSPVRIEVPARPGVRTITFAHRLRDSSGPGLAPVGEIVGWYKFGFRAGPSELAPLRTGFEITSLWLGGRPNAGIPPSLALPDQGEWLPSRLRGHYKDAGYRLTDIGQPSGWRFYLWTWVNPQPQQHLACIEVEAG
jgi:hypothetical protein